MPHPTRTNNVGGGILFDIKAGLPPAQYSSGIPPDLQPIWMFLEDCWDLDPAKRPSAWLLLARLRDLFSTQQPTPTSSFQPDFSTETGISFASAEAELSSSLTSASQVSVTCDLAKLNLLSGTRSPQRLLFERCIDSSWLRNNDPEPGDGQNKSILLGFLKAEDPNNPLTCLFDDCGKNFYEQDRALGHVRMHLGHKPYPCNGQCQDINWYALPLHMLPRPTTHLINSRVRVSCHSSLRAHISARQRVCPRWCAVLSITSPNHLNKIQPNIDF